MDNELTLRQLETTYRQYELFEETEELVLDESSLDQLFLSEQNERRAFFYWKNSTDTLTVRGFGHECIVRTEGTLETRYDEIERSLHRLRERYVGEGEAPLLFGSFSFDPNNDRPSEWEGFPSGLFILPSFLLRSERGTLRLSRYTFCERSAYDATLAQEELNDWASRLKEATAPSVDASLAPTVVEERHVEQYGRAVEGAKRHIREGDAEKIVIARSLRLAFQRRLEPLAHLYTLVDAQPNSYRFGLSYGNRTFIGATPERLVEVEGETVRSASVAGSIRRGKTKEEDESLGQTLLNDEKNLKEHDYVVQMIDGVFEAHCDHYTKPNGPQLLKVRDIQHLYTPIEGKISNDHSIFQFIQQLHPTPALGGVPTRASIDYIRELEQMNRGYYAAPIGWVDLEGSGEFAVALRSSLIIDDEAYLYAGGGIVADSQVEHEYDETWVKFLPMLRTFGGVEDE
ncbi:MAG TPA: isochorismate synthase [Savagea sp.]